MTHPISIVRPSRHDQSRVPAPTGTTRATDISVARSDSPAAGVHTPTTSNPSPSAPVDSHAGLDGTTAVAGTAGAPMTGIEAPPPASTPVGSPTTGPAGDGQGVLAAEGDAAPHAARTDRRLSEPVGARWEALGTSVHLLITHPAALQPATDAVRRVLLTVDETYSRFRPDSELQRLTARPSSVVPVSHLLARAIEAALRAARLTDGAVDPTVGRAMRVIGYDRDFTQLVDRPDPIAIHVESVPGWRRVRLDLVRRMLQVPSGVELDLGSTGKALAADLAAEAAIEAARAAVAESHPTADFSAVGVLVNLGGDIAVAGRAPDGGWRIALADDSRTDPDGPLEHTTLRSGALATSSTTVRRWTRGGVERHHIIDPATGLPAEGPWRTATVVAATCVDANAAATAAIIRGTDAPAWLTRIGLPARLVSNDGDVVRVGGWPAPGTAASPAPGTAASPAPGHTGWPAHGASAWPAPDGAVAG